MKYTIFRQPREASILYASTEEDLHTELQRCRRKRIQFICTMLLLILSLALSLFFLYCIQKELSEKDVPDSTFCPEAVTLQPELSDKVFRLHILANSDSDKDQRHKLLVRNAILSYLSGQMQSVSTKEEAMEIVTECLPELARLAEETLAAAGDDLPVTACVTQAEFPLKLYESIFLPAGTYDTLQIQIGEAAGQNWWCLLFPSLCLVDSIVLDDTSTVQKYCDTDVVMTEPDVTRRCLSQALEEREYEAIQVEPARITLKFQLLELFHIRSEFAPLAK